MEKRHRDMAYAMKKKILELAHNASPNGVHVGGALSCVEIFVVLADILNFTGNTDRDRLILSKGHGALSLYTAMWQKGLIDDDLINSFDRDSEGLHVHPTRDISRGIEVSGGSLGLGLSYAVGQAYVLKNYSPETKVHCIVGDGELDEGIVWEALMSAANYHLSNLTVTVDRNNAQIDGSTDEVMSLGSVKDKLEAFGFDVYEVNGHDIDSLFEAYSHPIGDKPKAVIATTVKGNGIDFLTNTKESHFGVMTDKKYSKAVAQTEAYYED